MPAAVVCHRPAETGAAVRAWSVHAAVVGSTAACATPHHEAVTSVRTARSRLSVRRPAVGPAG
ncbi:hypothetical protein IU11_18810 [Cellulosimicrobium sp. MM]|nr:hypothetical protein IU11_18810 [Cellulosimicrobium sp. MM]